MARRRVDDHPGRLVYDGDVFVFVNDVERDRLRRGLGDVRLGDLELHHIAGRHPVRGIGRLAVDVNEVALDQARGGRAAEVVSVLGEKAIQPRGGGRRDQAVAIEGPRELTAKPQSSWGFCVVG